jgi:hypothetical protein
MLENFVILLSTVNVLVSWIRGTSEGTAGGECWDWCKF